LEQLITYIGLDVHKETIAVALAEAGKRSEVREYGKIANTPAAVEALVARLARNGRELRFCYEAGPCGYGIHRQLSASEHACIVVAPSLIPRKPGERIKTDRRDAINLAKLHRAGELTPVWVPDRAHEAIRDLVRARQTAVRTLRQARQQLSGFLLRHGHHYNRPAWTLMHRRWLAGLRFEHAVHHIVLEDGISAIEAATARRDRLEEHIAAALPDWSLAPAVHALQALRGMALVAAATLVAELGDITRFANPRQLMAYLGLVPSEHSSGGTRRQGGITQSWQRRGTTDAHRGGLELSVFQRGSAASSCCGRRACLCQFVTSHGRHRSGCAGGIASWRGRGSHRRSSPPRSPASWQASSGQSSNRRSPSTSDALMFTEHEQRRSHPPNTHPKAGGTVRSGEPSFPLPAGLHPTLAARQRKLRDASPVRR
jgi:transposase